MLTLKIDQKDKKKVKTQKYYTCDRCGYISIIGNSNCPICAKDGKQIKMK